VSYRQTCGVLKIYIFGCAGGIQLTHPFRSNKAHRLTVGFFVYFTPQQSDRPQCTQSDAGSTASSAGDSSTASSSSTSSTASSASGAESSSVATSSPSGVSATSSVASSTAGASEAVASSVVSSVVFTFSSIHRNLLIDQLI